MLLNFSLRHGKSIMSALEVIVAENRAANNRQIRIGAQEIMRKQFHKIKQLNKSISLDFHWCMLEIEHNTVLIVIHIWRILHAPRTIIYGNWDDPVILPRWMICTSCVSFILRAEKTFRITARFYKFCSGNCFWILSQAWKD